MASQGHGPIRRPYEEVYDPRDYRYAYRFFDDPKAWQWLDEEVLRICADTGIFPSGPFLRDRYRSHLEHEARIIVAGQERKRLDEQAALNNAAPTPQAAAPSANQLPTAREQVGAAVDHTPHFPTTVHSTGPVIRSGQTTGIFRSLPGVNSQQIARPMAKKQDASKPPTTRVCTTDNTNTHSGAHRATLSSQAEASAQIAPLQTSIRAEPGANPMATTAGSNNTSSPADNNIDINPAVQGQTAETARPQAECGNCKGLFENDGIRRYDHIGHQTKHCTRNVSSDGFIHACPGHNTRDHDLSTCPKKWPAKALFHWLVETRDGKPPFYFMYPFWKLRPRKWETVAARPQTPGFARTLRDLQEEVDKRHHDSFWHTPKVCDDLIETLPIGWNSPSLPPPPTPHPDRELDDMPSAQSSTPISDASKPRGPTAASVLQPAHTSGVCGTAVANALEGSDSLRGSISPIHPRQDMTSQLGKRKRPPSQPPTGLRNAVPDSPRRHRLYAQASPPRFRRSISRPRAEEESVESSERGRSPYPGFHFDETGTDRRRRVSVWSVEKGWSGYSEYARLLDEKREQDAREDEEREERIQRRRQQSYLHRAADDPPHPRYREARNFGSDASRYREERLGRDQSPDRGRPLRRRDRSQAYFERERSFDRYHQSRSPPMDHGRYSQDQSRSRGCGYDRRRSRSPVDPGGKVFDVRENRERYYRRRSPFSITRETRYGRRSISPRAGGPGGRGRETHRANAQSPPFYAPRRSLSLGLSEERAEPDFTGDTLYSSPWGPLSSEPDSRDFGDDAGDFHEPSSTHNRRSPSRRIDRYSRASPGATYSAYQSEYQRDSRYYDYPRRRITNADLIDCLRPLRSRTPATPHILEGARPAPLIPTSPLTGTTALRDASRIVRNQFSPNS